MYGLESINNKNILITGGSGSIGLAIADGFEQCKANVTLWGHRPIQEANVERYHYMQVELKDDQQIEKAFKEVCNNVGSIDVLVNCAGVTIGNSSEEYLLKDWEQTLSVNLTAPFYLSQLIANRMIEKKKKGSIINITSIGAELGFPDNPAYAATKGGLKQLTKAFACDWAKYGIRVNNVGPGYTRTKMTIGSWENQEKRDERTNRTMLKHWADPKDIVGSVLFFASDMSEYITGQDLYVDGGWTAKGL